MTLTREKIEGLAPDQASLAAALKLVKPATWPMLAANADASLLWGECQGSGSTPYRVVVSPDDTGYKCTCPSRKFPCKHVLAVLWLRVDKPERFENAATPQWVDEWMARRRHGSGRPAARPDANDGAPKQAPSLDAALAAEPASTKPADPKAAARAQAQRERLKAEREATVLAGLDELDRWTLDQLAQGMATFAQRCQGAVRTLAPRLVDAKAGGLAARLDRLAADLFRTAEDQRADVAIERLATITLIASAYRHQGRLPAPLREDVRRTVGWTLRREELLADMTAPRVSATWIVAANLSEVQPDKLRRLETWLVNAMPTGNVPPAENATPPDKPPSVAVLIDYVPVSGSAFAFAFEPGEHIDGEVVFYPSAAPLRGLLASRKPASVPTHWPKSQAGLISALEEFAKRLGELPWLDAWPLMADGVEIRAAGKNVVLCDAHGRALPLDRNQVDALLPMTGLTNLSVLFTWDGRVARLLAADTPIGRRYEG